MTEFTEKKPTIVDVMQLVTGKPRIDGECVFDGDGDRHEFDFESVPPIYKREYEISGMCIACQNGVFG